MQIMRKIAKFLGVWTALLLMAVPQKMVAQNEPQDLLGMPTKIQEPPSSKQGEPRRMRDFFVLMPDSLMPMLEQSARKDLVDIAESKMTTALDNEWGGRSRLQTITGDYLMLIEDIADSITVEMALLPRSKDTLICLIRTIPLPQKDSELFLFNTRWQQQKPKGDIAGAALSPTHAQYLRLQRNADGVSVVASVQPITPLSDPFGRPASKGQAEVVYKWSGSKFVRQK